MIISNYKLGDKNPYIIKIWRFLKVGWIPYDSCTKEIYDASKTKSDVQSIFLGYACSYLGIFRNTYMPNRNIKRQADACVEIGKILKTNNVVLKSGDYTDFSSLKGFIIYCDPPYRNTQAPYYVGNIRGDKFDYKVFIDWCLEMSKYNLVYISEYSKPFDQCKLIYENGKEKLFLVN
jgi:site-specific DNA-adenine methylase